MSFEEAKKRIGTLSAELKQHSYNYYVLAMPTITDLEFDEKLEELIALRRNSQS
jgi:DNA ligase (NAD+)